MSATDYPQLGDLRLELEQDPAGPRNLLKNADGRLGGWGWITPQAGMVVERDPSPELTAPALRIRKTSSGDLVNWTYSEPFKVTASAWVNWTAQPVKHVQPSDGSTPIPRIQFEWLDSALNSLGESALENLIGITWGDTAPTYKGAGRQVPANAVYGRLKFRLQSSLAFSQTYRNLGVQQGTQAEVTTGMAYVPPGGTYYDVLGSVLTAGVVRKDLDVAVLNATIRDEALDPATASTVRPGRAGRLTVQTEAGTWEELYNGRIEDAKATYAPRERPGRRTTVTTQLVDAVTTLANASRPHGVATIAELPFVLEGIGVPWNVNGSSAQVGGANIVVSDAGAKAIDQVAITRDSVGGYAWVDRHGIVQAWDQGALLYPPAWPLDEDDVTDLNVSWDLSRLINEVTVKHRTRNAITGETVEVVWGPYRDQASVDAWGRRAVEVTVVGKSNDDATMRAFAEGIFARNATPIRKVNSVTVPIRSKADLTPAKALVDLYTPIRVVNANLGIDQQLLATSIEHKIGPGSWEVVIGFDTLGSVAAPIETPPIQQGGASTTPYAGAGPVPVGALIFQPCKADAPIPAGYLEPVGQVVSRTTYAGLFAYYGTTHNTGGELSTEFRLPDMRGRVPIGVSSTYAPGATEGAAEADRSLRHDHASGSLATVTPTNSWLTPNTGTNTVPRYSQLPYGITGRTGRNPATGADSIAHLAGRWLVKF